MTFLKRTAVAILLFATAETAVRTSAAAQTGASPERMIAQAMGAYSAGQLDSAIQTLRRARQLFPNHAETKLQLGLMLYLRRQADREAQELMESALADFPDNSDLRLKLLDAYLRSENDAKAAKLLDQAEKLMARNARFAFDVVYTLVYHGRFAWAKDRLTPVSQRLQGEVSLLSGLIAAGLNRRDEAAQFLDTASRLNYPPSDSPLMLMMAEACFRMNDFARAAAAYQSFLRHATQTAQTAGLDMRLGLCYFALGDHPRAVEQFEKAIKQAPDTPELNYYLASSLIEQKDTERAAAFLKEEIRRAPDSFKALTKLAYLAYLAGDNDSCRTWLEQASAKTQEWFETHLVYGLLLNRLGRYEEAVVRLEEAVRLEPTYPKSYFQLATAYRRTGNETKAAQSMETYQRLLAEQTQRALEAQGRADRPKPP